MRQARWPGAITPGRPSLAETATLDAGLAQQLTVLLLRHTLAALLDHGAHTNLPLETMWLGPGVHTGTHRLRSGRRPGLGRRAKQRRVADREPTAPAYRPIRSRPKRPLRLRSLRERAPQIVVHRVLRHTERPADPDGGQIAAVHQPVDGHLGNPHQGGHLGHGEEPYLREAFLGLGWTRHPSHRSFQARSAATGQASRRGGLRACPQNGIDTNVTNAMRSVKWPQKVKGNTPDTCGFSPFWGFRG